MPTLMASCEGNPRPLDLPHNGAVTRKVVQCYDVVTRHVTGNVTGDLDKRQIHSIASTIQFINANT